MIVEKKSIVSQTSVGFSIRGHWVLLKRAIFLDRKALDDTATLVYKGYHAQEYLGRSVNLTPRISFKFVSTRCFALENDMILFRHIRVPS